MKEVFDSYIDNAFGEYKQAHFKIRQFEINYRKFFPVDKKAAVLDIGIGRGEMLSCMKNWGYENYLGIDISLSTIRFCKSINLNCELVDDPIKWLCVNNERFELITLLDVLEHVKKEETISFLRALYVSLRHSGILIIQVPNLQAPDGQLHRYNDITHEVGYIEHSLKQVLVATGFKNLHFYGFEDIVHTGCKTHVRYILRFLLWKWIRFMRIVNGNLNPKILNPVFFALVVK